MAYMAYGVEKYCDGGGMGGTAVLRGVVVVVFVAVVVAPDVFVLERLACETLSLLTGNGDSPC